MKNNILIATVFYNLISKGYILTPAEHTNDAQVCFDVTHPSWSKEHVTELEQVVQIYSDVVATGRKECTQGVNIVTGETFHFGLGNNDLLFKDATSHIKKITKN